MIIHSMTFSLNDQPNGPSNLESELQRETSEQAVSAPFGPLLSRTTTYSEDFGCMEHAMIGPASASNSACRLQIAKAHEAILYDKIENSNASPLQDQRLLQRQSPSFALAHEGLTLPDWLSLQQSAAERPRLGVPTVSEAGTSGVLQKYGSCGILCWRCPCMVNGPCVGLSFSLQNSRVDKGSRTR